MADLKLTQAALDTKLSLLSGSTPIAWPNIKFNPSLGTMYLRPTFIPGKSTRLVVNDTIQYNVGIYQIDVFGEQNKGMSAVLDKLDAISDHFKTEQSLTSGNIKVLIRAINQLPIVTLDSWIQGSVQINYACYAN
jgi:hypothetical protein